MLGYEGVERKEEVLIRCLERNGTGKWRLGRRVAGAIKLLVNPASLRLQCVRTLHEGLFAPVLMRGSKTMI